MLLSWISPLLGELPKERIIYCPFFKELSEIPTTERLVTSVKGE
jgi:hypothetical protein